AGTARDPASVRGGDDRGDPLRVGRFHGGHAAGAEMEDMDSIGGRITGDLAELPHGDEQAFAVGAEGHGGSEAGLEGELTQARAEGKLHEPELPAVADGGEAPPVGGKREDGALR